MSSTPSENGSAIPLRPALREVDPPSPRSGPVKVVSIAEPENIDITTPIPSTSSSEELSRIKQFRAGIADKRMTGRPSFNNSSSRLSLLSQSSVDDPIPASDSSTPKNSEGKHHGNQTHHGPGHIPHSQLLSQVAEWLQAEKAKHAARKSRRRGDDHEDHVEMPRHSRTGSQSSDSSAISLEKLQRILEDNMSSLGIDKLPSPLLGSRHSSYASGRRRSSLRKLGAVSSDTEYQDGDIVVPSCDVVLDNSKTMSYAGGTAESSGETITLTNSKRAEKERKAWVEFKSEILRLAHTLRLKGWRKVPLERGADLEVKRLSGALTNAVYVVSPPQNIPSSDATDSHSNTYAGKQPSKLLLRIYGPQVERLIDRENELAILRRLSRKKIGPRMLGTFKNGRFEEFFNAQTLTADDLRVEDTSKQIAKRMRELHDGIDLLEREREEGPFVWRNWDKWVDRCEEVVTYLDKEIISGAKGKGESWRSRGLVCGVEWPMFKHAIDSYRKWLDESYGSGGVNRRLVFAHNDTQYGNILRLVTEPHSQGSSPSPLLLPQNTHKQLVVIDFEYASANTPGLEFANHFTEWCYNYHSPTSPWACNTANYPTLEQQTKFIRSYVNHRPQFNPKASATPKMNAMDGISKGGISEFLLDSRTPGGSTTDFQDFREEEARREEETERQVQQLLKETHIWRVANSAQWVAWGIVQAKVPELDAMIPNSEITQEPEEIQPENTQTNGELNDEQRLDGMTGEITSDGEEIKEVKKVGEEVEEDEFDYLAYAMERALFFWGDLVTMGLVKESELPENVRQRLKVVEY